MAAVRQLSGKLALVTGGGSGIGRAVCQIFAREGARVAVADWNEEGAQETLKSLEGEHHAFKVDVSSGDSVKDMMANLGSKFADSPSIAINCAGITRDNFMVKLDEKSFDDVINVNLKGTFLVNQIVSKLMIKNKIQGGSIVNISSVSGKIGNVGQANYAASKAGVVALTKTTARELGQFGIRCNSIMPGLIDTPMIETIPDKIMAALKREIPLGRAGLPSELAEACLFLASDKSSYITGTCILVSGGLAI